MVKFFSRTCVRFFGLQQPYTEVRTMNTRNLVIFFFIVTAGISGGAIASADIWCSSQFGCAEMSAEAFEVEEGLTSKMLKIQEATFSCSPRYGSVCHANTARMLERVLADYGASIEGSEHGQESVVWHISFTQPLSPFEKREIVEVMTKLTSSADRPSEWRWVPEDNKKRVG